MTASTPAPEVQGHDRHLVDPHLVRNLALILVIVALGFGFGRPLADGYHFGGCDDAADTQHYLTHVFGVSMCRDVPLSNDAESNALQGAEATFLGELEHTEEASSSPETTTPAS